MMEHERAIELRAAERYWNRDLSVEDRDQFEEHFFTCPECAEEVRWEQMFAANAQAIFREEEQRKAEAAAVRAAPRPRPGWFSWMAMRPALAGSLFANGLLLALVGYQLFRVIPHLRREGELAATPQLMAAIPVPTVVRGETPPIRVSSSIRAVPLSFVVSRPFPQYFFEITGEDRPFQLSEVMPPPPNARDEVILSIPTGSLTPGGYRVVLGGMEGAERTEIGHCRLQILK